MPPSPEWVAFDIDMSYGIMGGSRNSHMLTYQTTRPVKCIYFDGESAALFGSGQLDTQMLHIFGNVTGPPRTPEDAFRGLWDEYARAIGLCDWLEEKKLGGLGWGFEGIVRMNAGFEMIWCNFTSTSIRLISHLNVTAPQLPASEADEEVWAEEGTPTSYYPLPSATTRSDKASDPTDPPQPPNWRLDSGREPFFRSQTWNWFAASTSHYGSTGAGPGMGEVRVKITSCGFMNYYAPNFMSQAIPRAQEEQKSLNLTENGFWNGPGRNGTRSVALTALTRRRRSHTLEDISPTDAALMRADSERVLFHLLGEPANCSGMDWYVVTNEIVQTYAGPLFSFHQNLKNFEELHYKNETALRDWMIAVRDDTHSFLLPFIQYPNEGISTSKDHYSPASKLFNDTYPRCRFHHTRLLDPEEGIVLGPEESTLKWAIEETTSGICNVLVDVGLSIEELWQQNFNLPERISSAPPSALTKEVQRWIAGVEELMAWLGWAGEWISCDRKCEWDEKCFIPMWPLLDLPGRGRGPGYGRPGYPYGPGYGRPPPYYGPPWNGTGPPRGGGGFWMTDESSLWQPKCVKSDYFER